MNPNQRLVGRILCVDENNSPQFTVHYRLPFSLRDPELFTEHGIFRQNHQTTSGTWVYQYARPLAQRPTDPDLSDYRYPTDPTWDGPEIARPTATWTHVLQGFQFIRSLQTSPEAAAEVDSLLAVTEAAFERRGLPAPRAWVPHAIPDHIIDTPPPVVPPRLPDPVPARGLQWVDFDGGIRTEQG